MRALSTLFLLGILTLVLAACATSRPPAPSPARPAPAGQAPVTPAPQKKEAAPSQTPPSLPPEQISPPRRIALLAPLSGPNARIGESLWHAAQMALQTADQDTGDSRGTLVLTPYDTYPDIAVAAQRALADGVDIFLGPLLADNTRKLLEITQDTTPVFSFSNDRKLAQDGAYVLGFQPAQSITRVVAYARAQGVTRFAALIPEGVYGHRAAGAFRDMVTDLGGTIIALETYPRDPAYLAAPVRRISDYAARVAMARQSSAQREDGTISPLEDRLPPVKFEALLIPDTARMVERVLPLLARYVGTRMPVRLMGSELWNSAPGLAAMDGMNGAWFAAIPETGFQTFAMHYRQAFGQSPSRLASLAYDGVALIHTLSQTWAPQTPFPWSLLQRAEGFSGVDGLFRFRDGLAERAFEVRAARGGAFVTVSPAPTRFDFEPGFIPDDVPSAAPETPAPSGRLDDLQIP